MSAGVTGRMGRRPAPASSRLCTRCGGRRPVESFLYDPMKHKIAPRSGKGSFSNCEPCRVKYAGYEAQRHRLGPVLWIEADRVREHVRLLYTRDHTPMTLATLLTHRAGGTLQGWDKWLDRLPQVGRLNADKVDRFCIALGLHLSMFDPYYDEVAEEGAA